MPSNKSKDSTTKAVQPLTRLEGKHFSPLVLRKYTKWGPPLYVALITDDNLDDLDERVLGFIESKIGSGEDWTWPTSIQDQRDIAGGLANHLFRTYNKVEGLGVMLYADKMFVSSLHGDFMTHLQCKLEFYQLLNLSSQI